MKIFLDFTPSVLNEKLGHVEGENLYCLLQTLTENGALLYIDNSKGQITEDELKILKENNIPVFLVNTYPFHGGAQILIEEDRFIKAIKEKGLDYTIQNPFSSYAELKETVIKNNVI